VTDVLVTPEERLAAEKLEFLDLVKQGIPRLHAAMDVGWAPRRLSLLLANAEFNELVVSYESYIDDEVEMVLLNKARQGNMDAVKMWLLNRKRDKWADKREISISGEVTVAAVVIEGTVGGLRRMLESQQNPAVVQALSPGGSLDEEVCDAELLD
jgi:hypothetical protein